MSTASPAGSYQRWLTIVTAAVMPCAVAVLVMVAQWTGLRSEAALEQAVVARRVATGQGFTTDIITPRSLAFAADPRHHPELRHGPLAVLPAALLLKFQVGGGDRPFVFGSMLAWLCAVGVAVLLARGLFGRTVGLLTLVLLLCSPSFVASAISADGRTWAMPLLLVLWLVLASPQGSTAKAVIVGVLLGLASLVAYALTVPLLLTVLPAVARVGGSAGEPVASPDDAPAPARPRLDPVLPVVAAVVMLLVVAPWLVRNQRVAGAAVAGLNSYAIANFTEASPGRSIERRLLDPGAGPVKFALNHKRQLVNKALVGAHNLAGAVGQVIDWPLLGLFLGALLLPLAGERGRARAALAKAWLVHAGLLALTNQEFGQLACWTPIAAIYAAWFLSDRLHALYTDPSAGPGRFQPRTARRLAVAALALVLAVPGLGPQMAGRGGPAANPSEPNFLALEQLVPANGLIATDDPWNVAWRTSRTCVWLPQSTDDLKALDAQSPVTAIYFTRLSLPGGRFAEGERAPWWSWAQVMPAGFLHFRAIDSRVDGERILLAPPAQR